MTNGILSADTPDAELVAGSLAGNREAFGGIVARYQSLICSLAYSATGNLGRSEDLAQDTFLAAWRQLRDLREPEKLRAWLCRIARNHIYDAVRDQKREPAHAAEPLEALAESPASEPQPPEHAMSREEEAILWRLVERIPGSYREPLILFYREHQSVERVAETLELSEDAVKQRLSRGRKLLHEEVLAFVEGALERTNPGKAFTVGVLAALPAFTMSAKAATLGAAVAKGSGAANAAAATGMAGGILAPMLGIFGMWFGYRMNVDAAKSDREREFVKGFHRRLFICLLGYAAGFILIMVFARPLLHTHYQLFIGLVIGLALAYMLGLTEMSIWSWRVRRKMLAGLTVAEKATNPTKPVWEYRSKFHLLGLPFIHVRMGDRLAAPLKAWVAIGDCAFGVLFAFGGLAVAPVSVGGCAVGLLSVGGTALGVMSLGGFSLGAWSFGGLALGWRSFGMCALAWNAAMGAAALAHDFALGAIAQAAQANNAAAQSFMNANFFFNCAQVVYRHYVWFNLLWLVPAIVWGRITARQKRAAVAILLGLLLVTRFHAGAQDVTNAPTIPDRFDDLVRDDMFSGDTQAFDRAMKLCEDRLAANPKYAPAMSWHGAGLLSLAGKAYQTNNYQQGSELWQRGLKEMDGAVALQPDSLQVLIPRGATYLGMAKYVPDPEESKKLVRTGVADYEKVMEIQKAEFASLAIHSRGELLFGLADGWFRLGDLDKSRQYLRRITKECEGSAYSKRAGEWLAISDQAALRKKSNALTCIGCHK